MTSASKLTAKQCDYIRWTRSATGKSTEDLARQFGVSHVTLRKVLKGTYRPAEDYDNYGEHVSKDKTYTITMNDGTTQVLTRAQIVELFNAPAERTRRRLDQSGWRTEALLRLTAQQAMRRNANRFRKVLSSERNEERTPKPRNGHY